MSVELDTCAGPGNGWLWERPILIVYRVHTEAGIVEILRLWHTKRDWQSEVD
jgi:hypothetical protein